MPNIEIHGVIGAVNIQKEIFKRTETLSFCEEIVVTIPVDDCRDRDGKSQPFLRIVTSEVAKIKPLVQALEPLGMDMEILHITGFVPAEK